MDTAQVPILLPNSSTTSTCERISTQLQFSVTLNSGDDDSGVRLDPSGQTESELEEPKPNFRIDVNVEHASPSNQNAICDGPISLPVHLEGGISIPSRDAEAETISESMFSTPPQSEDYPLSLISWYSEPADTGPLVRSCCTKSCIQSYLQNEVIAQSPLPGQFSFGVGGEESDKSDEKENKTPPPPNVNSGGSNSNQSRTEKCLAIKMKLENSEIRDSRMSRRLDRKCDGGRNIERSRSVGNTSSSGIDSNRRKTSTENHEPMTLECPRCSRKSKSGHATPLVTSRVPKRTILVKKDISGMRSADSSRKPIKSILKSDLRGCSSGSEKQSSMDSLGSNHTSGGSGKSGSVSRQGSASRHMTSSDLGPRLKTKFSTEFNGKQWTESDFVGLKRIERYATVRIHRDRPQTSTSQGQGQSQGQIQDGGRKLSFENLGQNRSASTDLMTKSMPHVKTENELTHASTPFLQRNGSLRGRRTIPTAQPCATRTSVLRLQKMQEKKGLTVPNLQDKTSSGHSDSGESTATPAQTHSKQAASTTKVFTKLSSATGQTASSAQKRQRQERGIQTEPILILKKPEPMMQNGVGHNGLRASGISRSPTPMSPDESPVEKLDPTIEILTLRQELKKYKARVIKYEHIYNAAEQENVLLGNHLRDVEKESREMINFLQDEKLMLAESLAESEVEKQALMGKLDNQAKLVAKLEEKLNLGRSKVREANQDVANYTTDLESESLKTKTLQDEVAMLRKRVEKLNEEQE